MLKQTLFIFLTCALVSLGGGTPVAFAVTYDIKEMTPAVKQAIENRQARYSELQQRKTEGVLGEDNQGFVKALKQVTEVGPLVLAENYDREVIYQAIVDQNQLGPAGMAQVRSTFGEVQRGKVRPGDWIQLRSGEWKQK